VVAEKEGKGRERRKGKVGLAGGVKGKRGREKEGERGVFLGRKYGSINSSCFFVSNFHGTDNSALLFCTNFHNKK